MRRLASIMARLGRSACCSALLVATPLAFALPAAHGQGVGPAPGPPELALDLFGCEVYRALPTPAEPFRAVRVPGATAVVDMRPPGTLVKLLLTANRCVILGGVPEESIVESMTDDRGVELLAKPGGAPKGVVMAAATAFDAQVLPDGLGYLVSIHSAQVPTPGGRSVRIKGRLAVRVGTTPVSATGEPTALADGATTSVGAVSFGVDRGRLGNVEQAKMMQRAVGGDGEIIGLVHREPLDAFQEFLLVDAKSGAIVGRPIGRAHMANPAAPAPADPSRRPAPAEMTIFQVNGRPESFSLKATYWSTIETKVVPFDFDCGIGLNTR